MKDRIQNSMVIMAGTAVAFISMIFIFNYTYMDSLITCDLSITFLLSLVL